MNTNTKCSKIGIKIHETKKEEIARLATPVNYYNTSLNSLDLDLNNYTLKDLYQLFNITDDLNEYSLKMAKQIVLKMHPDKSQLDSKYFLFFSKAYKRLYGIYEFQNKSSNKVLKNNDYYDEENKLILNNIFENNKSLKNPKDFNNWFNNNFEKHRIEDPLNIGYGEWLKSDNDFIDIKENVTKVNMNEIFEAKKKQIQSVTMYTGVKDLYASTLGGSLLSDQNSFTGDGYTDLKEAYTETLIPITKDDYDNMPRYNSLNEYIFKRDSLDITPVTKDEGERILYNKKQDLDNESSALAYKYAKETEQVKKHQQGFWGDLKQLTNW
jgi:hypothetical protein